MALGAKERNFIAKWRLLGAHPALIATLLGHDARTVADAIELAQIPGPQPLLPRKGASPSLREQIRAILTQQTRTDWLSAISQALDRLDDYSPEQINLLLKTFIEEHERLVAAEQS